MFLENCTPLLDSKFFAKARAPRQKYTSSIRSIPLNSTTLFTCTFLDPARFNLHERVARTSIKRIVELFAIVYLPKKDTFTDGEAWRKIATPTASCPLPSQRRNVEATRTRFFSSSSSFIVEKKKTRVEVSLATSKDKILEDSLLVSLRLSFVF